MYNPCLTDTVRIPRQAHKKTLQLSELQCKKLASRTGLEPVLPA